MLFIGLNTDYDSAGKGNLYSIVPEFGIGKRLVRLIKVCLDETYSEDWKGQHVSDNTLFRMV
jgi:hypothetical protein